MNTRILLGVLIIAMTFCMSSCQNDAEIILFSGSEPITQPGTCTNIISSAVIYLNSGNLSQDIGITNGKGGYSVTSSDESVVTATIKDNRLLLASYGKKGKAVVTVKDKKDNVVSLPVTVSYAVFKLTGIYERINVFVNGQQLEDEALTTKVQEALASYFFIKKDWTCVLQPTNSNTFLTEQGTGTFIITDSENVKSIEGTFKTRVEQFPTGKSGIFDFNYNGGMRTMITDLPIRSVDQTRDMGPVQYSLLEDLTNSVYLQSINLPENSKVIYAMRCYTHRFGPAE